MITIDPEELRKRKSLVEGLREDRLPFWNYWREVADYFMPKRYTYLATPAERLKYLSKNPKILDPTGTFAGRILASGLMNGITSPSRPWFKLRLAGYADDIDAAARVWLDEVERRMLLVMSESNFYNALAVMYLDLVFFGTAAVLIYEDYESVIRCYNCALGEFYFGQSDRQQVNMFAREFTLKVHQVIKKFGIENCSAQIKLWQDEGGKSLTNDVKITHLIEPVTGTIGSNRAFNQSFAYREMYWETAPQDDGSGNMRLLALKGYHEPPGMFPRWEVSNNDSYGTAPGMDTLGDVVQLQHETMRKSQSLDYLVRPPLIADVQLSNRAGSMLPGGITFVQGLANHGGAKPVYQVAPPIQEITLDIRDIQMRIKLGFYNNLFNDISNLDTVRSATEIDARREEKLILVGPVLERFENEALNPSINRIFGVMDRAKLLPPAPPSIQGRNLQIQYVSILATAQTASGVIPTERFLQLVGNLAGVYPEALDIPNVDNLLRNYGRDIGIKAAGLNTTQEVDAKRAHAQELKGTANALAGSQQAAQTAKLLSETQVGGGANALNQILQGAQ